MAWSADGWKRSWRLWPRCAARPRAVSEVAHDARNMVTALGLYCDLLEEPGVLAVPFTHYAHELRLVAAASRRLVEKLVTLDAHAFPDGTVQALLAGQRRARSVRAPTNSDCRECPMPKSPQAAPFENSGRKYGR